MSDVLVDLDLLLRPYVLEPAHRKTIQTAYAEIERLRAELREIVCGTPEFEDARVSYVSIQIDRDQYHELRREFGLEEDDDE